MTDLLMCTFKVCSRFWPFPCGSSLLYYVIFQNVIFLIYLFFAVEYKGCQFILFRKVSYGTPFTEVVLKFGAVVAVYTYSKSTMLS